MSQVSPPILYSNLGIVHTMARTQPTTEDDFNHLIVQAAIEKEWKIVDTLFHKEIEFNETSLQTLLLEAFKQRKKCILYGIMYSPFIDLEKCVLHGIENSDENFVNYLFRHNEFNEDFIIIIFKRAVQNHQLRIVKLLLQDTSFSLDIQTILEASELLKESHDVTQAKDVQNMRSLLNQRLDYLANELANSTDLIGLEDEVELCQNLCPLPSCPGYHTTSKFLWQISLGGSYWINLPQNLVDCLEDAFSDPSRDGIALPRLDPAIPLHAELLCVLGREVWKAEFTHNHVKLKNAHSSKSLFLRRHHQDLSTIWYYQEDNGSWAEYTSNINSDLLEYWVMQNVGQINFQINGQNYIICFDSMTQKNLVSGKIRAVKRRPKRIGHPDSRNRELHELLPHTWDEMATSEVVKRVKLVPWSVEYKAVYDRIVDNKMVVLNNNVTIERMQNPYLWRTFQNRIQEMREQNWNPVVLKLFHCSNMQNLDVICQENIDYRMYVNRHGYGTYFHTTFGHAKMNSQQSPVYILAQVAVGTPVTTYHPKMTRPPISDVTNLPFDTAVDNIGRPSLYVKYEAQEYYPEYIIQINFQTQSQPNPSFSS